ncbi:MAG: GTP cyclohydrolase I FolE [Candidatus Dormibacteraeota bacterium]|nr:GTP cyclohydrolase I FolE [Candidatus Dormibacteraeota bacterium]
MSLYRPRFETDPLPALAASVLEELGEDVEREGLRDTPRRVAESLRFLTEGYSMDPPEIVGDAMFEQEYDDMVIVKDIKFFSLCEHHLLPFFGRAHVAYLPQGRVVGLSKLPRIVDAFAHRLQLQERLTRQIADAVHSVLEPAGVGVILSARHLCMEMRGVEKQDSETVTSCMLGVFRDDPRTRSEFMELVRAR